MKCNLECFDHVFYNKLCRLKENKINKYIKKQQIIKKNKKFPDPCPLLYIFK